MWPRSCPAPSIFNQAHHHHHRQRHLHLYQHHYLQLLPHSQPHQLGMQHDDGHPGCSHGLCSTLPDTAARRRPMPRTCGRLAKTQLHVPLCLVAPTRMAVCVPPVPVPVRSRVPSSSVVPFVSPTTRARVRRHHSSRPPEGLSQPTTRKPRCAEHECMAQVVIRGCGL